MKRRQILFLAGLAGAMAGAVGGITAYRDMQERRALEQQLEEWQRQEWVEDLIEMRREEMINRREYKPS